MLTYTERMAKRLGFQGGRIKAFDGYTKGGKPSLKVVASNKLVTPPAIGAADEDAVAAWVYDDDTTVNQRKVVSGKAMGFQSEVDVKVITPDALLADIAESGAIVPSSTDDNADADKLADVRNGALVK